MKRTIVALACCLSLSFPTMSYASAEASAEQTTAESVASGTETPASDAPTTVEQGSDSKSAHSKKAKKKPKTGWKTKKLKAYYYRKGKKVTGLQRIGKRTYFFDAKGIQRTGWRKVDGYYRFFKTEKKKRGYMVTSQVINGVRIGKTGKAHLNTSMLAELKLLVKANELVDENAKPLASKKKKLRAVWKLIVKSHKYHYQLYPNWSHVTHHRAFARGILFNRRGDCNSFAAAFAYIATAIGFKNCSIATNGSHGWTMINGRLYDLEWSRYHNVDAYNLTYSNAAKKTKYWWYGDKQHEVRLAPNKKVWSGKKVKDKPAKSKTGWNSSKTVYYHKGKKAKGVWGIGGKLYAFKSDGALNAKKTTKLQKAAAYQKDISALRKLLGKPKSAKYTTSCLELDGFDGQDGRWKYAHCTITTFKSSNGNEYFMSAV